MTRPAFWPAVQQGLVTLDVYVYQRPHIRDDNLEFELEMGRSVLDACFDTFTMCPHVSNLTLSFPERWLNIIEERCLYDRLWHYCPNLKQLTIKTQSVYIIQMTKAPHVKIVKYEQPLPQEGTPLDEPLWLPMIGSLINANKLNILSTNGGSNE